jgi:hypothetical protein
MAAMTAPSIRARLIAVAVLLLSYGALGARQPAVRTSIPLPVPAEQLARSLGLDPDRSQLLVSIVRLVFDAPDGDSAEDAKRRVVLSAQLKEPASARGDLVPLPLDTSIWRETLLPHKTADTEIVRAIFADRATALLYHGLAALDDDTLGWLGPDRETLLHLRRNAAVFAAFGRSVRIRAGRVAVPGGMEADPVWAAIVGADPARPAAFVQRLLRGDGRLAWLYDTLTQLDSSRQRLAMGDGTEQRRIERLRDLLQVFEAAAPEWRIVERPLVRPALDPSVVLSLVGTTPDGELAGPAQRRVWESVFREETGDATVADGAADSAQQNDAPVELAWLARRVSLVPPTAGRRRLETFLFAQRAFANPVRDESALIPALRGAIAFPALAVTLERIGITSPSAFAAAARTASALNNIRSHEWRRVAVSEFQSALAIIDRAARWGGIDRKTAGALTSSLVALPISMEHGYAGAFAAWLQEDFVPVLPLHSDSADPLEEAILLASAGIRDDRAPAGPIVEWEGRRYRVDPAAAELNRLRRVRERQRAALRGAARSAATIDRRLAALAGMAPDATRLPLEQALAETLISTVYAMYLGEPDGAAVSAGDAAARHDFGLTDGAGRGAAWRFPREEHGVRAGWRVVGSLLGLELALGRLSLRRLDLSDMPAAPTMSTNDRMSAMLTASLFGPRPESNDVRDEIASAIARGRRRVAALSGDTSDVDRVARDAGFSDWRREALRWTLEHERENSLSRFSLLELFWLGSPRGATRFDGWGAARVLLDGCLCLRMPPPEPWELQAGRASTGYLGTRGADVTLRVAELLSELKLPGSLAPPIVAYAMQDVMDLAQPAFLDDWPAFERTARDLPRDRLIDYVAAVAADGAFVPVTAADARH